LFSFLMPGLPSLRRDPPLTLRQRRC